MRNNPAFKRLLDAAKANNWDAATVSVMAPAALRQIMFPPDGKPPAQDGTRAESARRCLLGLMAERQRDRRIARITEKLEGHGCTVVSAEEISKNRFTVTLEVPE